MYAPAPPSGSGDNASKSNFPLQNAISATHRCRHKQRLPCPFIADHDRAGNKRKLPAALKSLFEHEATVHHNGDATEIGDCPICQAQLVRTASVEVDQFRLGRASVAQMEPA
jgi:hypothetical protein